MFCLYCRTSLPDDAVFCNKCGKQQNATSNEPTTGVAIHPSSPLSEASTNGEQLPAGDVSMVQETPSTSDRSSGQSLAESTALPASPIIAPSPTEPSAPLAPTRGIKQQTELSPYSYPARAQTMSDSTKIGGHLSRRAVLALTGATAVVAVGGSITWLALSRPISSLSGSSTNLTSTPKHQPSQTVLLTYRGHSDSVKAVTWSPDGLRIASASDDKTVQVWDATTGSNVLTYRGHSYYVLSVAWSPNGQRIASGGFDTTVQVWDAVNGGNVLTFGNRYGIDGRMYAVAWSPDGQRIASGDDYDTVHVWNAATGNENFISHGHAIINDGEAAKPVTSVVWSPDGQRIASASVDNTVQVWDATTGNNILTYRGHSNPVSTVVWSPDGQRIASAGGDTVQVWDATTGGNVLTYSGHSISVSAVTWSPDGLRIASGGGYGDNSVQVWDATTGNNLFTYKGYSAPSNFATAMAWSPDGTRVAVGSADFNNRANSTVLIFQVA